MKKNIMVLAIALAFAVSAHADTREWNDEDIMPLLDSLGIMEGDGMGNYSLDRAVSRAEMAKITVNSSQYKDQTAIGMKVSPFNDVPSSSWSAPYILNGSSNGLFKGYIDGSFHPDDTVTYEEAVTMILRVLGYGDDSFGASYPYGQVNFAKNIDLLDNVNGDYGVPMTRAQIARMVYNALRANQADGNKLITNFDAQFYEDVVIMEVPKGSGGKVTTSEGTCYAYDGFSSEYLGLRGDMVVNASNDLLCFVPEDSLSEKYVVYSVLNNAVIGYKDGTMSEVDLNDDTTCYKDATKTTYAAIRNGMEMGDVLNVKYTEDGSVDYCVYETGNLEGPIKVVSGISGITTNASTQYMRDGNKTTASGIVANDIIYYSEDLNMVLAYSTKVSGIYQDASPSRDNPTTVTISGKEYAVEGVGAYNDLSSSGSFKFGDTITVCLGKDGASVAGVVTSTSTTANTSRYGYVMDAGKKNFDNSDGTSYSSYYVSIVAADGNTYEYTVKSNAENYIGNVVRVAFSSEGSTVTSVTPSSGLSGKVDADNMKIGSTKIAQDCEILDTVSQYTSDDAVCKRIYLQRLDGMNLTSSYVRYYHKNSAGEVDELILSEATGDCYYYGMVLSATINGDSRSYKIDVNGETVNVNNGNYAVSAGTPCKMKASNFMPVANLKRYSGTVSELTTTIATIGGTDYRLSDEVAVYEEVGIRSYNKISLNDAISGNYTYSVYYDKTESEGGRIRVIVANKK